MSFPGIRRLAAAATFALAAGTAQADTFTDFGAFQSAVSGLTTEDFETAPPWETDVELSQPVTNLGVTWTAPDSRLFASTVTPLSGSAGLTSGDVIGGDDVLDRLVAVLPGGISAVGGWVNNLGNFANQDDDIVLTAFGSGGTALETVTAFTGALNLNQFVFIGLTTTIPIDRIEFSSTGPLPGDDFALDDFSFGTSNAGVIPEPSSMVLLGIGVTVLGVAVGRRRRPA